MSKEDFQKLMRGEEVSPDEVIYCPECGNLAVNWDNEHLMFYKEDKTE